MSGSSSDDAEADERAARVARAWLLHTQRWSSRDIGAELGVSHVTAQAWIKEAREAAEWSEIRERAGRRARMGEFLNELARRGVAALEGRPAGTLNDEDEGEPPQPYKDVVPALMRVVTELNRVEGNYAPTRFIDDTPRTPPSPALARALEAQTQAIESADDEDLRRELEQ